MGEDEYPFYHRNYQPPKRRAMKEIKRDYNKYLKKFELAEKNRYK
jgi:hypothetical protein